MTPRVLSRLLQIQRVLVRHRLDGIIRATHLFRPLRFAFYLSPATWFRRASEATRGERLRLARCASASQRKFLPCTSTARRSACTSSRMAST